MCKIFLLIILLGVTQHVFASENIPPEERDYNIEAEGRIISQITIVPPKRTKVKYIRYVLNIKEDDVYTKAVHTDAYIRLWKTGLFHFIGISTEIIENTSYVDLIIEVKDKWTLYPVPILLFNDGNIEGGLALVERNMFGLGKTLVSSGFYGLKRFFFHLIYNDPNIFLSNFSLSLINFIGISQYDDTTYGKATIYNEQHSDKVNTIVRRSQGLLYASYARIGYKFLNNIEPFIAFGFSLFDNAIFTDEEYEVTDNTIASSWHIPIALGFTYNTLKPYGVQSKGLALELEYALPLYSTVQLYQLLSGTFRYALGFDKREINLFTVYIDGAYGNTPLLYRSGFGGTYTSRSISKGSIRTNRVIAGALEHSITVFRNTLGGILVGYGGDISLYEVSEYEEIDVPVLNGGVFVNFGFVLNQLAIPVVTVNLGYNIAAQYMVFSFSVGSAY